MDTNSAKGRSKVSNGHGFLGDVDGRSTTARRARDLLNDIYASIGCPGGEGLTLAESQATKRLAGVLVRCEQLEARIAAGNDTFDDQTYISLIKQSSKIAAQLGLDWDYAEASNAIRPVARMFRPLRDDPQTSPSSDHDLRAFVTARAPLYEKWRQAGFEAEADD